MSLSIKNLTKEFGDQKAVDGISFEAGEGEILGFLGPNGAGKSTTMKIATCYLPPTEGSVEVCGFDVVEDPISVRKKIGYLPEHNPLYLDMYVHEYLRFMGRVHSMKNKKLLERVGEMVELCGLEIEQNKKIGSLSKGYRQRVGLAQSLIHDPEVLIMDEPTTGLDPNQILEIRDLIKKVSKNKTVVFSTHIMQEVQALCDRVVVINQGKLAADDHIDNLLNQSKLVIRAEFEKDISKEELSHPSIQSITVDGLIYHLEVTDDIRSDLFRLAAEKKMPLVGLNLEEQSIEAIFRDLTKKEDVG